MIVNLSGMIRVTEEMGEHMELIVFLRVLLRRWYLVLIPVLIVAVVTVPDLLQGSPATSGGYTTAIRYTAAQELDVPGRDGDYQDIWLASELTVNALTEWVRSGLFKQDVADLAARQGVEVDPSALAVASDNERSIGVLYLSWPDRAELDVIVDAAIEVLHTRPQAYFPQLENEPARVTLLDEPVLNPAPPPLTNRFAPFIRLGLGLLVGVGLAFLAEYFDNTLRRRDDVEKLGMPVVASIPHYEERK